MELDLNQEPLDQIHNASVIEFDSVLDEIDSAQGHIHDRIRHLEAVTSRARQRHRWPPVHNPIQITNSTAEATTADVRDEGREHEEVEERTIESGKGCESKGAHLVAKALGVETDVADGRSGNFFDCNICLDMARDPVVTCCGHLFCWPCFYRLSYAYSNAKECPVCKGEVTDRGIIPIYGNASVSSNGQLEITENGLRVPSRPHAPRVESFRQQLISQGASSSIIHSVQRFNNLIGGFGERFQSGPNIASGRNDVLFTQPQPERNYNQSTPSHPISRLLLQGAASFSSLSSALNSAMNSAERLVQDLEAYVHGNPIGGSMQLNPGAAAANHSGGLSQVVAATNATAVASVSPLSRNDETTAVIGSEVQTADSSTQIRSSVLSSHGRRRTDASRQVSNEPRRRRLR